MIATLEELSVQGGVEFSYYFPDEESEAATTDFSNATTDFSNTAHSGRERKPLTPKATTNADADSGGKKCIICMDADVDATFIHGQTGHTVCCFDCAKETEKRDGKCPVCREPVRAVIRNFT